MRTLVLVFCGFSLAVGAMGESVAWTWDNYLTPGTGYDGVGGRSSEFNTRVAESWTGDDLFVTEPVELQSVSWIGLLQLETGAEFTGADFMIFPAPAAGFPADAASVLSSAMTDGRYQAVPSFTRADRAGQLVSGLQVYDGSLTLPTPITLDPGHYYYAVRVHGNLRGRNYIATTGSLHRHSDVFPETGADTVGAFQSPWFSYPPNTGNWVLVTSMPQSTATDYAYQLHGVVVPEPAALGLMAAGVLGLLRRR